MQVAISGNTYPVKEALKAIGAKWNPDAKAWMVASEKADEAKGIVAGAGCSSPRSSSTPFRHHKCTVCGVKADRYTRIYRSGECGACYEERKMGY